MNKSKKTIIFTGKNSSITKSFINSINFSSYNLYIFTTSKRKTKDEIKNIKYIYLKKYFSNINEYKKILSKCSYFFHCAYQNDENFATKYSYEDYKINIHSLENILNTIIDFKNLNFIFFSTVSLYSSSLKNINEKSKIKILSQYNLHKYYCEKKIRNFSNISNPNYIILRTSNLYGDNDLVKRDFILQSLHKIKKNYPILIFGSGNYLRDYLHLDDVNKALKCIIKNRLNTKFEIYNFCSGNSLSINNTIKKMFYLSKKRELIKYKPTNNNLTKRNFICKPHKFSKTFNWQAKINIGLGLKKLIKKI